MSAEPIVDVRFPVGRPLAWEDLQAIPDDQYHHYELVDGNLLVSPSPDLAHQVCVTALWRLLADAAPIGLLAVVAPFDFVPRPGYSLQPDVLVVDRARVERQRTVVPPLLAVEVLSPSSRSTDRTLKRLVYEEHGVPAYWIVDPTEPSLLALHLEEGRYLPAARVAADQAYVAEQPFPVTVVPAELLADLAS